MIDEPSRRTDTFILLRSSFILCLRSLILLLALFAASCPKHESHAPLVIGSKNFTESVILGELVAQKLESAGCTVDRRLNLGGTFVCDAAIRNKQIDAYVEYSGTALTAILKAPTANIWDLYGHAGLIWGPNLGFNNTFAMIVRKSDAEKLGLRTISDLGKVVATFRPGFGYEFVERTDGWNGLQHAYNLTFATQPKTMDLGLTYKALASNEVDLVAGNSTDGLIESLGLVALEDDKHFFPRYDAAPVWRQDIDQRCKGATKALNSLHNTIDDATMRRLNYEVDGKKRDVAVVAREFLGKTSRNR